jgi:hypothetical protein
MWRSDKVEDEEKRTRSEREKGARRERERGRDEGVRGEWV